MADYWLIDIIRKYPEAKKETIEGIEKEIKELQAINKKAKTEKLKEVITGWKSLLKYLKCDV